MIPTGYNLRPIIIWICYFTKNVFESDFINLKKQSFVMTTTWSLVFDYKELAAEQIDSFVSETEDMMQETSDAYNCKIDERLTWRFSVNTRHLQRKCAQHFLFYSSRYWRFCWLSFL